MPELPEVETIRRGLEKRILRKKIIAVEIAENPPAGGPVRGDVKSFIFRLKGQKISGLERLGKLLVFNLSNKKFLLIHLKMTGQLIYSDRGRVVAGGHNLPPVASGDLFSAHTRAVIAFADKSKLFFNDLRRFGYLKIVDKKEKEKIAAEYGIDPLSKSFVLEKFKSALLGRKKSPIKAALLDQTLIAGIGNIYADEICFAAGVFPGRRVQSLSEREKSDLFRAIRPILRQALKFGGTTFRNFTNAHGGKGNFTDFLQVYGRQGKPCLRCKKGITQKKKIAGRGTSYCNKCQK